MRDWSFVRTYDLKQQTPLIHFQHNQFGVGLRATEVKPKLDRFICEMYRRKNKSVPARWKLGEKDALKYRMSIVSDKTETIELDRNNEYNIFYGNMGSAVQKKGVFSGSVKLTITCVIPDLLSQIDALISDFFIVHNFGTMQRKGFGSFVIGDPGLEDIKRALCSWYQCAYCYSFPGKGHPFPIIKLIYSIMKSGINYNGYRRSLLFLFMHSQYQIGNEKAWLKESKMAPIVGSHEPNASNTERAIGHPHYYVRALLGTGDHIQFLNNPAGDRTDKTTVTISYEDIKRFKSPIFFKVINEEVYYVCERINQVIYGKWFQFSTDYRDAEKRKRQLQVPDLSEIKRGIAFEDAFMDFCWKELNMPRQELEKKYPGMGYKALSDFSVNGRTTDGRRIIVALNDVKISPHKGGVNS